MLAVSLLALALVSRCAVAGPTFLPRDATPTDTDLLQSCRGSGPGSPNISQRGGCTLINIVNNPDVSVTTNFGPVQGNCEGSANPISVTVGGETTIESSTTANVDVGVDFEGISIGGGLQSESSTSTTTSNSKTITVNPGRQAVMTMSVINHSQTGGVQVNYGSRVDGHFIWFTGAQITQLTPTNQITYDVHETACGTNALDLNNHS